MKTFKEWLAEDVGIVSSNPANDARYAEKGVKSNREGDQPPAMPGAFNVDPVDMYVTGKSRARRKKQAKLS
jgi:hypothetical protein